jgi:leader peptidase (prepilin peptidase) / N-methyltransferase
MEILFAIGFFVFGLLFGSFLNVCIHRIPRQQSVVFPSSACPVCKQNIKPYDNIPVISWLFLGGRCRNCKTPITPRYATVELITGFLFLACYWQFGFSISALKYCVFSFLITGLVFIDAEWKLLPDLLTIPGLLLGLAFSWFVPVDELLAKLFPELVWRLDMANWSWRLLSFCDSVLGAAVGAAFIFGVGFVYLHARGVEGMGFGDVKLMGMVGAFLGVKLTIFTIFAASIVGTVFGLAVIAKVWMDRTRRRMIRHHEPKQLARKRAWSSAKLVYRHYQMPFGVFLGSMALVSLFLGGDIMSWYLGFYR